MTIPLTSTWAELEDTWAGLDTLWARGTFLQIGSGGVFKVVSDSAFQFSVNRGRSRDLERTNAGTLSASFRNQNRRFDPRNPLSDLDGYIVPRNPVQVNVDGEFVFTGIIDDWNFDYEPGGQSIASITASDGFSVLARQNNAGGSAVEEGSGSRVERILNQLTVNWPLALRDIDSGNATLEAGLLEGNALSYLQAVEESEAGLIFTTKEGFFAFRQRLENPVTDAVNFVDGGTGVPYEGVEITFGTELLANRSTVASSAGVEVSENADSIAKYGVIERDFDTLLSSSPQLVSYGQYIVARYGEPEYRVEKITVNLGALSDFQKSQVLGLEIGDQADVIFTPNKIGQAIALRNRIIGISHDVNLDAHRVSIAFEELPFQFFVLDDDVFGRLDNTVGLLGF